MTHMTVTYRMVENLLYHLHESCELDEEFNQIEEIRLDTTTGRYWVQISHDSLTVLAERCVTLDWATTYAPSIVEDFAVFHVSEFDIEVYKHETAV